MHQTTTLMIKEWSFYKLLSGFTAILFAYLFLKLLLDTQSFLSDIGLQSSEGARILAQRASMFMLGISVLMFGSNKLPHSRGRQAICLATAISMLGLSILGAYELSKGTISSGIIPAIVIETILWLSFGYVFIKNLRSKLD